MNKYSRDLFEFISDFMTREAPPALLDAASDRLMDTLGCALYGGDQEWTQIVLKTASNSVGRATAFGTDVLLSAEAAALCNGTAAHGFELDDVITDALAHPGAVVIPAALAVAEEEGVGGTVLLKAIIAGYEMMGRLGRALGPEASGRGWHLTCVAGPAASAVAVGSLLGFNEEQIANAVGIACASAGGNKAFSVSGGMVKRLHAGLASRAGILAARLVQAGFTGPSEALDGRFGLLEVISGNHQRPNMLTDALGEKFDVANTSIKIHPCCAVLQSTLEAITKLKREHGVSEKNTKAVRVGSSARAVEQNNEREPADVMAAQYSLPFCASLAMLDDPVDPRLYTTGALNDPDIKSFMPRISMYLDNAMQEAYPRSMGARVSVELEDGRVIEESILDAHGMAQSPCSHLELEEKFRRLAGLAVGDAAAENTLAAIANLRGGANVGLLSQALRTVTSPKKSSFKQKELR
jgi:2-methylcitrate dehydratase PrpD